MAVKRTTSKTLISASAQPPVKLLKRAAPQPARSSQPVVIDQQGNRLTATPRRKSEDVLRAAKPEGRKLVKPFGPPVGTRSELRNVTQAEAPKHPSFKKIYGPKKLLPTTTFIVDFGENLIVRMETVVPEGLGGLFEAGHVIEWFNCGQCGKHIRNCTCDYYYIPKRVTDLAYPRKESE